MPSYLFRCLTCGRTDQRIIRMADVDLQKCEVVVAMPDEPSPPGSPAAPQPTARAAPAPAPVVCGGRMTRAEEVELIAKTRYGWQP